MARRMCDMTPEEQERARMLARLRQQRRRDRLRGKAVKKYQRRGREDGESEGDSDHASEEESSDRGKGNALEKQRSTSLSGQGMVLCTRTRGRPLSSVDDDDVQETSRSSRKGTNAKSHRSTMEVVLPSRYRPNRKVDGTSNRSKGKAPERRPRTPSPRPGMRRPTQRQQAPSVVDSISLSSRHSDDDDQGPSRKRSRPVSSEGQTPSVQFEDDPFGHPLYFFTPPQSPSKAGDDDVNMMYVDMEDIHIHRTLPPLDASSVMEEEEVLQQLDNDDDMDSEVPDRRDMIPPIATLSEDEGLPTCVTGSSPSPVRRTPLFFMSDTEEERPSPLMIRIKVPKKNVTQVHSPPRLQRLVDLPPSERDENDLVTGILGVQVHVRAETIRWKSGQRTVLPYLPKHTEKGVSNLLENEERYTRELATLPEAGPLSKLVVYLDKDLQKDKLWKEAREALADNKGVIVRGYVDTEGFQFNKEDLEGHFDVSPRRPVQVHDMTKRVLKMDPPHLDTRVGAFVDAITNTAVSQAALGFPLPQFNVPEPFGKLDDGLTLGWAQTQSHAPISGETVPADVWTVRSWASGHHAAIVTFPHHHADGACTFVIVMSGQKSWVVVGLKKGARGDLPALVQQLTHINGSLLDHLDVVDAETIHMAPGDMIIMPPGLVHSMFTQEACFCRGGHFYNIDTMHLAEVSRFIDYTRGDNVTNDSHKGVLETLSRMVIGLTVLPESRKLYKRSLVALCGMVVHHADYDAKGGVIQVAQNLSMALEIAQAVLARLGLGTKEKYLQYLSSGDIFDKGEQLSGAMHRFLHSLDTYRP